MKATFVCDCCGSIFDEIYVDENEDRADDPSLTGEAGQDIILQDRRDSEQSVTSTCRECRRELDEYEPGESHFWFHKAPMLH